MITTLTDALYFVKAQLKEVGETSLDDMLILEYLRQSIGLHQDMLLHYLKDVSFKEVAGSGALIPLPLDLKTSIAHEIIMEAGKGTVFSYNLIVNGTNGYIKFTALEPKEQHWTFNLTDNALEGTPTISVNPSTKTVAIDYFSQDVDAITRISEVITLLTNSTMFRQFFAVPTSNSPNAILSLTGVTEQTLGSGEGFHEVTYLPFAERKSIMNSSLLEPKENLQMYYCLHEALVPAYSVIEILPNTMTHYRMTYPISLIPATASDPLKVPTEVMSPVTAYTVLKLIQRNLSASMAEEEQKLYLSAYKIQANTYENQLRQVQESYSLNNPKLKTA